MLAILSLFVFTAYGKLTTLRWAKDAGEAPSYHRESDGSVTAIYPIMSGTYEDIEPYRRRLAALTQSQLRTNMLDKHNELRALTANGLAPCRCGSLCGTGHRSGTECGDTGKCHPGATNMNSLFWDTALEKVAQQYADKCLFIHNSQRSVEAYQYSADASWNQNKEKYMGENLYISSTGEKVWNNIFGEKDYGLEGGLQGWWDECIDFQLQEGGSCGSAVGHYTQYIRADSRFVGCGVTICPSGVRTETSTYSWANMNVVCNYAGGQYGDVPYGIATTAAQVASECEPDRIPNYDREGLCGGPQATNYFEDPQSSYDKTSFPTSIWICDDGTGRDKCDGAGSGTPIPTPYPTTSTTTKRPTNMPVTPQPTPQPIQPTDNPSSPPTTGGTTPVPTQNVVTPMPTGSTPSPITPPPTKRVTREPTGRPTTTSYPSKAPVAEPAGCDLSDCTFSTNIQWKSESWKYRGFADACWNTENSVLNLEQEPSWGGKKGYSWGGQYRRSEVTGQWVLYVWDDIDIDWTEMECTKRDYFKTFMSSIDFEDAMKSGIESIMGSGNGEVTDVTVTINCDTTAAQAFGAIDASGNIELPFSTWNLNTYDFSDWFVLLFVLFTGCTCCFGCGWYMHRRRVFKAMDEASIGDFHAEAPMVPTGGNGGNNYNQTNITNLNDNNNNTRYGNTNEQEIEIGVSVNSNRHGIIGDESD